MRLGILVFTLVLLTSSIAFAQSKNKLSFELGYGLNTFLMQSLNQDYVESDIIPLKIFEKKIEHGSNFFLNLKFQPSNLFDVGGYGNYQFGSTSANPKMYVFDDLGQNVDTVIGDFVMKTEAVGLGVTNSWYISHILRFQDSKHSFLKNFRIATEFGVGVGFSKVTHDYQYPTLSSSSFYDFFTSQDFQGQVALKLEYDYLTNPIFGTIGLKFGYQYFKTKTVKDHHGKEWVVGQVKPINLDFSGLFGSVYVGFGK
tara:strand:+ start:6406 stop:7173 length:768 start_codon:yes stop_codon:yes gene_type:complete